MRHKSTRDIWSSEGTDFDSDQHVRERLAISQREIQILMGRCSSVCVQGKCAVSGRKIRSSLGGGYTPRRYSCSENSSRRFSLPFQAKLLESLSRHLRAKARNLRTANRAYSARMHFIQIWIIFYLVTYLFFPHSPLSFKAWTYARAPLTATQFCTLWDHKLLTILELETFPSFAF
jgi:hypothetical protein